MPKETSQKTTRTKQTGAESNADQDCGFVSPGSKVIADSVEVCPINPGGFLTFSSKENGPPVEGNKQRDDAVGNDSAGATPEVDNAEATVEDNVEVLKEGETSTASQDEPRSPSPSTASTEVNDTTDKILTRLINEHGNNFPNVESAKELIYQYEKESANQLRIVQSRKYRFIKLMCASHSDCPFCIRVGKTYGKPQYKFKLINTKHSNIERITADGRAIKKRRHVAANAAARAQESQPITGLKPLHVMNVSQSREGAVPYMAAYREVKRIQAVSVKEECLSFQRLAPYLDAIRAANPGSTVVCETDSDTRLINTFVSVKLMNEALQHVRPVVALDTFRLRGRTGGILYMATVMSGANHIFPIGFGILAGEERTETWSWFLRNLARACPNIQDREMEFTASIPRELAMNLCAVGTWPDTVVKQFSFRLCSDIGVQEDDQPLDANPIFDRIHSVDQKQWEDSRQRIQNQVLRSGQDIHESLDSLDQVASRTIPWLEETAKPMGYAILLTQATKSFQKAVVESARRRTWLDTIQNIVETLVMRASKFRYELSNSQDDDVVDWVIKILLELWSSSSSLQAAEVVPSHMYMVKECSTKTGPAGATHMVKIDERECSCNLWRDLNIPCRHAVACYRQFHQCLTIQDLASRQGLPNIYRKSSLKSLFKSCIIPVAETTIVADEVTRPPPLKMIPESQERKRKRIRPESLDPNRTRKQCSLCKELGHNSRTCPNYDMGS